MEIKKIDLDQNVTTVTKQVSPVFTDKNLTDQKVNMPKQNLLPVIVLFIIAIGAGIFTGSWLKSGRAAGKSGSGVTGNIQAVIPSTGVKVGDVFGSTDETSFKDKATGVIDKGGLNGEGTHKLVRPGGPSQTVYLTSSVIDLDQLVGDQVTVWGETFKGQKVGWLMDVGRAKVENLNMPLPQ